MIYLSVTLVEGDKVHDHRNKRELFFKEANFTAVPIPKNYDMRVSLGIDDNGEETGWSCMVDSVWFESNGDICIQIQEALNSEIDPFDKFVQYLRNDGFLTYDEWNRRVGARR